MCVFMINNWGGSLMKELKLCRHNLGENMVFVLKSLKDKGFKITVEKCIGNCTKCGDYAFCVLDYDFITASNYKELVNILIEKVKK